MPSSCSRSSAPADPVSFTRVTALLLVLLAGPGGTAAAQAAPLRAALERAQADLQAVGDTQALRQRERELGQRAAGDSAEAERLIRRSLVRIRLGTLGDGLGFGRAARDLSRAGELEPAWVFPWYARGVALRGQYQWLADDRLNLGKRVGFGSLEDAVEAFQQALRRDPLYVPALQALHEAGVTLRDTTRLATIVLPALRAAGDGGVTDPAVLRALARTERILGDPNRAVEVTRELVRTGDRSGLDLHDYAASALAVGDSVGEEAYYAGAARDDSPGVAAYREDLALIADSVELARFDATRGPARAAWLRQFWTDRARASLRDGADRLGEHYRRIAFAERNYGLEVNRRHYSSGLEPGNNGFAMGDLYRSGGMRFDDRGVVYIRYGEPSDKVQTTTFGIQPNESWTYHRADGDLMLQFAANTGGDIRDYRLIPTVAAIGGVDPRNADAAATFFAFNDRCRLYPPFCKYLNWGTFGRARMLLTERAIVVASTDLAVTTDAQELRFPHPLGAAARAFAVGLRDGRPVVHVAFQVALARPESLPESAVFRTPLRIRINLMDSVGQSRGWLDTTTAVLQQGGGRSATSVDAVGRVTLAAPPGDYRYQIALAYDDSTGQVLPSDVISVGRFDGSELALSDLVLSREGKGAPWSPAPGDTAWFNPRTTWDRKDVLAVYHEVYGLTPGTAYREELVLRRGKKAELSLGWSGVAEDATLRVARVISLAKVKPGRYEMEFVVRLPDGRSATTSQPVTVE